MTGPARIGVVLAGGRATRMGGDKASASLDGATLLARAVEIVRAAGLEPRVCARATTTLPHVAGLDAAAIWREPPSADGAASPHPLAGLAHALTVAGTPIVALPVDLPLLPPQVLRALAETSANASVLGVGARPAALVARVDPSLAGGLASAAAHGAPALRTLLALGAAIVDLADLAPGVEASRALANVNGPDDLAAVERLLATP